MPPVCSSPVVTCVASALLLAASDSPIWQGMLVALRCIFILAIFSLTSLRKSAVLSPNQHCSAAVAAGPPAANWFRQFSSAVFSLGSNLSLIRRLKVSLMESTISGMWCHPFSLEVRHRQVQPWHSSSLDAATQQGPSAALG